jgi:beta-xylosidase
MTDIDLQQPEFNTPPAVIAGYYADPNLTIFDGRYYLYPTTDGLEGWRATSFRAFSSRDLSTWTDHGEIFSLTDVDWASEHAWAPTVARRGDSFYLYFTAENNIGVAVADSPVGPFVDLGRPLIRDGEFSGRSIDPSVFVDVDDTPYLYWGNTVAHGVPLNDDMVSFDPARVVSWKPTGFREAAWVHEREGTYYLSWSENDTREADYRVRYATSSSALGPWTDRGILLEKLPERGILATGHHSILRIPDSDEWLIAYHRFAIPGGSGYRREVVIDRLDHSADGLLQRVIPAQETLSRRLSHHPKIDQDHQER